MFEELEDEFAIAHVLIKARAQANLTQSDVAKRMNTTHSAVARLEGGANPSIKMLKRYAKATGTKLSIQLASEEDPAPYNAESFNHTAPVQLPSDHGSASATPPA